MMINLKDQIVILDEAHNIEDSSREAGSVQLTSIQLEETQKDLEDLSRRLLSLFIVFMLQTLYNIFNFASFNFQVKCGILVKTHRNMANLVSN